MNRFDVFSLNTPKTKKVVVLQSDIHHSILSTTIAAPLVKEGVLLESHLKRLMVPVEFQNDNYFIIIPQLSPLIRKTIGSYQGSLNDHHHEITDALDFLFQGF